MLNPDPYSGARCQRRVLSLSIKLGWILILPLLASALSSGASSPAQLPEVAGLDIATIEGPKFEDVVADVVAVGDGTIWIFTKGQLLNVDPHNNQLTSRPVEGVKRYGVGYMAVAIGGGSAWTLGTSDKDKVAAIYRLDPATGKRIASIELPQLKRKGENSMAFGQGALWVLNHYDGTLLRIDPNTNQVAATIQVGKGFWAAVQVGEGGVWIIGSENGTIKRVDPQSNKVVDEFSAGPKQHNGVFSMQFKGGSYALSLGEGGLWVTDSKAISSGEYTLFRINPKTHDHVATIHVDNGLAAPVFWKGFAWVSSRGPCITKIDPVTNRVVGEVPLQVVRGRTTFTDRGTMPPLLQADEDSLWAISKGSSVFSGALIRRIQLKK